MSVRDDAGNKTKAHRSNYCLNREEKILHPHNICNPVKACRRVKSLSYH